MRNNALHLIGPLIPAFSRSEKELNGANQKGLNSTGPLARRKHGFHGFDPLPRAQIRRQRIWSHEIRPPGCGRDRPETLGKVRGFILLPVVLTLALLAAIALIMNREGAGHATRGDADFQAVQARYLAEAGLARQTWRVQKNNCAGYGNLASAPLGADAYSATVSAASGSPVTVTATGTTASGASRSLNRSIKAYKTTVQNMVLQPDAATGLDGWIEASNNTTNHGAHDLLQASSNSERLLIKFDLSSVPKYAKVASASLGLFAVSGSAGDVFVQRIARDWSEGTCSGGGGCTANGITWDTYDGSKNWTAAGGDFDPAPAAKTTIGGSSSVWYAWDITDLAADWVSGDQLNYGVLVMGSGSANATFASSDNSTAGNRPKLTLGLVCECGQVCVVPTKPIARWTLDETSGTSVADVDGGHTGTKNGGTWVTGRVAGGLYLNGTSAQTVSVANAADLSPTSSTLSAWINSANLSGYRMVLAKGTTAGTMAYKLGTYNNQITFGWANGSFVDFNTTNANLQTNTWYHIAGSYDATTKKVRIYLNGTELLNQTATILPLANTQGITLGRNSSGAYWQGTLDDVRIYNAAISPEEIVQIYNDGASQPLPATTVTLSATADAYLRQDNPTSKLGGNSVMVVGGTIGSSERRGWINFNASGQIPPGAIIQSATLRLNESKVSTSGGGGLFAVNAHSITASWSENNVTWNTAAAFYNPTVVASATINDANGWKTWNVTALVQEWVDGISPEYGIALRPISTTGQVPELDSRDSSTSANRPQLVVTYQ